MVEIPLKLKTEYDGRAINQGLTKLQTQVKNLKASATGIFAALVTVQGLRMLGQAVSRSIDFANALSTLDALTKDVTQSTDELVKSIQDVTSNQLSMAEAAVFAGQAITLFGQAGADTIGDLTKIAGQAATVFGKTIPEALDMMLKSIASGRTSTLRQLGIFADMDQAALDLAESLGKDVEALTDVEIAQSNLNAVLEAGVKRFGDLEIDVNILGRLETSVQDFTNVLLGTLFGGDIEGGFKSLAKSIENLTEQLKDPRIANNLLNIRNVLIGIFGGNILSTWVIKAGVAFEKLKKAMLAAKAAAVIPPATLLNPNPVRALSTSVAVVSSSFLAWSIIIAVVVVAIIKLNKFLDENSENIGERNDRLRETIEESENLTGSINDLIKEIDDEAEATEETTGKLDELKASVIKLIEENPKLATELRLTTDEMGNLVTMTGLEINSIDSLQSAFNSFSNVDFLAQLDATRIAAFNTLKQFEELRRSIATAGGGSTNIFGERLPTTQAEIIAEIQRQGSLDLINRNRPSFTDRFGRPVIPTSITPPPPRRPGGGGGGDVIDLELIALLERKDLIELTNIKELERIQILEDAKQALIDYTEKQLAATEAIAEAAKLVSIKIAEQDIIQAQADKDSLTEGINELTRKQLDVLAQDKENRERDLKALLQGLERSFNKFLSQMADISGLVGGGPGGGLLNDILKLGSDFFGAQLGIGRGGGFFGAGGIFGKKGMLAGAGPGLAGAAIAAGAGFGLNRAFGTEASVDIDEPRDVRIVDISTHLLNFFNFRGLEGSTYRDDFRGLFEGGAL